MIRETYKFRIYPTDEQKALLEKHFGCVRFVYNWALDYSQKQYARGEKFRGWQHIAVSPEFKQFKLDNPWLKEVNSQSICNTISHLGSAFERFFKGQAGFPKFKCKGRCKFSFEVPANLKIDFKSKKLQIPKFLKMKNFDNRLKFVLSRHVEKGKYGRATVSRNKSGQYFISFIVYVEKDLPKQMEDSRISKDNSLGFDFGLKHFLTLSDGRKFDSPEFFKRSLEKVRLECRRLSRKRKGSKNREKQRVKLARAYLKISNQRSDFLNKLSAELVKESQFDCFCFEDLNLDGMKRRWGRKVSDLSFGTFARMMEYKSANLGKRFVRIGRFDPSSQICSSCGHRKKMPLSERIYVCPHCGQMIDRDVNAAVNIRDFALMRILRSAEEKDDLNNTDGTSGINDCGDGGSGIVGICRHHETAVGEAVKVRRKIGEAQPSSAVA